METGGETPSSSLSNAASSSSPSSGSGQRPHSAGAVFSFNIPIGSSQSDSETGQSQELLAVIGDNDDDDDDGTRRTVDLVSIASHHFMQIDTGDTETGGHSDTMLFLLPSGESSSSSRHQGHQLPLSAESPQVLVQRQQRLGVSAAGATATTDTSPSENKENTAPNSPLVASANYKQGNYFRFPDVDAWTAGTVVKINSDQLSSCSTPSDTLTLGILSPPDVVLPDVPRNSPMRRTRLKSISLDSESAKAVEDTLNMGMQGMCLQPPQSTELLYDHHHHRGGVGEERSSEMEAGEDVQSFSTSSTTATTSTSARGESQHPHHHTLHQSGRRSFRNRNQLKIDLKSQEEMESGIDSRQHPPTPKTPTLTQSRQKAISLDSDQQGGGSSSKAAAEPSTSCCAVPTVSASVPTTPKRHLVLSAHRSHHHHHHHHHHQQGHQQHQHHHQKSSHQSYQLYHHQHSHGHQFSSSSTGGAVASGSSSCRTKSRSTSEHLGSNLQRLKTVTLSVSNNNLKTLPEVMPLSDFGSSSVTSPLGGSSSGVALPSKSAVGTPSHDGPAIVMNTPVTTPSKGRSSLLQRRGSNHSLTLNLAGSVGDLSGSTSHIAPSASGSGFGTKRGLLQRRGSNASLTLTIQGSDSALSRFNSHGSLNEGRVNQHHHRKSLLSVSNCNLRSSMDVSRLRGQPGDKAHGKFFSSEENLMNNNKLSYCHIESIDVGAAAGPQGDQMGSSELGDYDDEGVRQITTKPLSPQSTSEDFKIYLANIQYLQNASNVLRVDDIRDLATMFIDLGAFSVEEQKWGGAEAAARLQMDEGTHLNVQRRKLREIHQEFWDLPTNHQDKAMVFGSQHKNRYKTILPNEHSRVILKPELGDATRTEPYINANYVKGPTDGTHEFNYIATQGPMANTVFDFWLMAMQDVAGELGPTGGHQTHNKSYSASFMDHSNRLPAMCPMIVAEDTECSPAAVPEDEDEEDDRDVDTSDDKIDQHRGRERVENGEKLYIVMLTNFMENGRPKCATYFPEKVHRSLCFYSGSGSESQCESSMLNTATNVSSVYTLDCEESAEEELFREWYEQHVKDDEEDLSEWHWVRALRRTNDATDPALSRAELSQSASCFIIRNTRLREKTGYSMRDLQIKYVNGPARECFKFSAEHFWFPDWPDHKSPGDLSVVLDFALDLLKVPGLMMSSSVRTPDPGLGIFTTATTTSSGVARKLATTPNVVLPILHCSAGIGRTGCMVGILNALRQMIHSGTPHSSSAALCQNAIESGGGGSAGLTGVAPQGVLSSPSQSQTVDILGIVCNLRLQRGGMVQNSEQYELIHRVLCLYQQKADESNGRVPEKSFLQRNLSE